jgi:hypothetical protein
MSEEKSRRRWTPILLVIIPVWLIVSAVAGLWLLFRHEKKEAEKEQARFAQSISTPLLTDDLKKIVTVIGERNPSSELSADNLSRMASMIEGLLGPSNTGFAVKKHRGPAAWPILQVTIRGKTEESPIWVVTSYDSRQGSKGAEANATGLAATFASAQAMASDKPARSVHFAFVPHLNDRESQVLDSTTILRDLMWDHPPSAVLAVEAMGDAETLWLTSRDLNALPLTQMDGLGKIVGAEVACLGEDSDLASILFEMNVPAVRVATRAIVTPDEEDDREPFAPTVSGSTGRLVELVRRLAAEN